MKKKLLLVLLCFVSLIGLTGCKTKQVEDSGKKEPVKKEKKKEKIYKVGDLVTYKGIEFYVLKESDEKEETLTLIKVLPLTTEEVNQYGEGHLNKYRYNSTDVPGYNTAIDIKGYGALAYYTSETCGANKEYYSVAKTSGCTPDYNSSEIKYIVDNWSKEVLSQEDLKEDELGYTVRLLSKEDMEYLGYKFEGRFINRTNDKINVLENINSIDYWTMIPFDTEDENDAKTSIWVISNVEVATPMSIINTDGVVKPVITLLKSAIQ